MEVGKIEFNNQNSPVANDPTWFMRREFAITSDERADNTPQGLEYEGAVFGDRLKSDKPVESEPRTLIVTCYAIEQLAQSGTLERAAPMLKLAYSADYRIVHDTIIQGTDGKTYHFLIAVHRDENNGSSIDTP